MLQEYMVENENLRQVDSVVCLQKIRICLGTGHYFGEGWHRREMFLGKILLIKPLKSQIIFTQLQISIKK